MPSTQWIIKRAMDRLDRNIDKVERAAARMTEMEAQITTLQAELDAAHEVIKHVRWAVENHYAPPPLYDALVAYDAALRAAREGVGDGHE